MVVAIYKLIIIRNLIGRGIMTKYTKVDRKQAYPRLARRINAITHIYIHSYACIQNMQSWVFNVFMHRKQAYPRLAKHTYTYSYAICHYWPLYQYVGLRTCNYINDNETFFKFISEKFSRHKWCSDPLNEGAGLRF